MGVCLIRTYTVYCDEPGCGETEACQLDAKDALEEAIHVGWHRKGKKTYCPDCAIKYKKKMFKRED